VAVVTACQAAGGAALVVIIPKLIREKWGIRKGQKFLVKEDQQGRIIFEHLKEQKENEKLDMHSSHEGGGKNVSTK